MIYTGKENDDTVDIFARDAFRSHDKWSFLASGNTIKQVRLAFVLFLSIWPLDKGWIQNEGEYTILKNAKFSFSIINKFTVKHLKYRHEIVKIDIKSSENKLFVQNTSKASTCMYDFHACKYLEIYNMTFN